MVATPSKGLVCKLSIESYVLDHLSGLEDFTANYSQGQNKYSAVLTIVVSWSFFKDFKNCINSFLS